MTAKNNKKITVLMEMRPALDGFAGIPQETRLLFRGLKMLEGVEVEGMIQSPNRTLARGLKRSSGGLSKQLPEARKINRYSRVIISLTSPPHYTRFGNFIDGIKKKLSYLKLLIDATLSWKSIELTNFESRYFKDFVWRALFAKTLPAADFNLATSANHKICSVPWNTMNRVGLAALKLRNSPKHPILGTNGFNVFIAQTPYPARTEGRTALVVRYHDAIPILMPHTIKDRSFHQRTHYYSLLGNVNSGAYFACVSEATRRDLVGLFPQVEARAVTIHNMISPHYFYENSSADRIPEIIRSRFHADLDGTTSSKLKLKPDFSDAKGQEKFFQKNLNKDNFKYLLIVSTIEPRKNHTGLIAAWEQLKSETDKDLRLVIVGSLGWDYHEVLKVAAPWINNGEIFMIEGVPARDLRVLYRHATATVCPSLAEGFDFSGVESMSCGGVVVASDIPVHREVYDDAAEYFDPYSTNGLVEALHKVIYAPDAGEIQESLRRKGQQVSARYQPDRILPKWQEFLDRVVAEKSGAI